MGAAASSQSWGRDNALARTTVRISYSPTGEPILDSYYSGADFDRNGGVDGGDLGAFFAAFQEGDETADVDQNGGVDGGDFALFLQWHEAGFTGDHTLDAQRFLYRGYHWDDTLKMYHVRHRVYDPARMLWIQRDPLGRIPGVNEYAYCLGEPVDSYDPYGLWNWDNDWVETALHLVLPTKQGDAAREGFVQGAHDGLVVTLNSAANTLSGGLVGRTREELGQSGDLYDPDNPALGISETAGKAGAGAAIFAMVVMSGGALAPEFAATIGGAAAINAAGGAAASIYIQSYEVRAGQRSEISAQQVLVDAAFAGVLGGVSQGITNYLRFGPNLTEVVLGRPAAGGITQACGTTAAETAASGAGPYSRIGSTGQVGEDALKVLGGESQVFYRTTKGGRYIDQLVKGIGHESKVGYKSLTPEIEMQIAKDAELIQAKEIERATWHFFKSPVTGRGGPSQPLIDALEEARINWVIE